MRAIFKIVGKNLRRRPFRTLVTIFGTASAFTLFVLVESLSAGLDRALSGSEAARTLIVYRKNRYCPQTSFLPEFYAQRIAKMAGVDSVLPVKVFLNNCRASLDLVAFQGAPVDLLQAARKIDVVDGDFETFRRDRSSALLGKAFAERRRLSVGDQFKFGAIDVKVAGIFKSPEPTEEGVIVTHLEYLQRAGPVAKLGTVTMFEVKIADATQGKRIAEEIDLLFKSADAPTDTRAKVLFLATATKDLSEILRFGRILGLFCVLVVLVLVGNTVVMSVSERRKEFAVFLTLGYRGRDLFWMVIVEAVVVAAIGAGIGIGATFLFLELKRISIASEGVAVTFAASSGLLLRGVAAAVTTGVSAGLFPAIRSARADVVDSLRSA